MQAHPVGWLELQAHPRRTSAEGGGGGGLSRMSTKADRGERVRWYADVRTCCWTVQTSDFANSRLTFAIDLNTAARYLHHSLLAIDCNFNSGQCLMNPGYETL